MAMVAEFNPARDRAQRTLGHYLRTIADRAGVRLDGDCTTEIDSIVDDIIDAAVIEMRACEETSSDQPSPARVISDLATAVADGEDDDA